LEADGRRTVFTMILGEPAVAESTCPVTGEVLTVADAFDRSRATCEALGWLDTDRIEQ
jgi:hypothetical protein